ncbi:MAG: polyprenyl synthetase family protein [Parcubacteria group bacterium]|jgi:geranylgeranyl diphosphate synthase type I
MGKLAALEDFKRKIDVEIEKYLDRIIKETAKRDAVMAESIKYVKKLVMAGGKRLRPAFMYFGYLASGGKEKEKMLRAAVSMELIHIFLLIHDDIMDRDDTRHGIDAVHVRYENLGKKLFKNKDFEHFGNSMAIIIGDMVGALGNQIIFESQFKPERIMQALAKLQTIVSLTVIGQSQDIYIEYRGKATEKDILKMYENKTAKYTVEGPLHLGAILGGAKEEIIKGLSQYAIPLGTAFQIQDDLLGIFGSEQKLGKKVGADIIEGKQTLLVARAKAKADRTQRKILDALLGKTDLSKDDIEKFQDIMQATGAYEYAKKLSHGLVLRAKQELEKVQISKEAKDFLNDIADYMIEREL